MKVLYPSFSLFEGEVLRAYISPEGKLTVDVWREGGWVEDLSVEDAVMKGRALSLEEVKELCGEEALS